MVTIAYPEYAPDRADMDQTASDTIKNVVPNANGYGPLRSLMPYTAALSSACRGARMFKNAAGTNSVIAGTATALFRSTGTSWTDVSGSSAPYGLADGHSWSMTQFGEIALAANINDPIQAYTLGVSTDFADLGGSPPQVRYIWNESGFVGAGHAANAEKTIYRSGLNAADFWTIGLRGADSQEIPDGGVVMGGVPDSFGAYIFSESWVHQLVNQPGNEIGFSLVDFEPNRGTPAPDSIVRVGPMIFFVTHEGFYQLGQPSTPIGLEKIDSTFVEDVGEIESVQGAVDFLRRIVWWRYKTNADLAYSDRLLGYWWPGQKWAYAEINLEWIMTLATAGYTLEELETQLGYTSIETIPYSLDSDVFKGGRPSFGGFDTNHKFGFFSGDTLEATLDTADIPLGGEGRRAYVSGWRPVGDVIGAYGSVGTTGQFGAAKTFAAEQFQHAQTGLIPGRADGRTHRFRLRIPAATQWTHVTGIEVPPECARSSGRR